MVELSKLGMRLTLLFASGIDLKVVQCLMGHSDPSLTMRLYIHYRNYMGLRARKALDCLIIQYEKLDFAVLRIQDDVGQAEELMLSA